MTPGNGGGRRIGAVLFDCDGVLVDSERVAVECIVELAARHGAEFEFGEALDRFTGGRMADTVREVERRAGRAVPRDFEDRLRARMAAEFEARLEPMDGAAALVEALDVPFCVVSNGPRAKMEVTLRVTGLLQHFAGRIVSAYEVGAWKPDPALFLHAAQLLGVAPECCAVVEDSGYGIAAGLAAGMQVFALVGGERSPALPEGVVPVASLSELHDRIGCRAARSAGSSSRCAVPIGDDGRQAVTGPEERGREEG